MAASDREASAVYTVSHDTGTTPVTVSQRTNGGAWVSLGSFSLDPALSPSVELSGNTGSLSADALRFVAVAAPPANVLYVHTDHLGTPRLMTDSAAQVVWDHETLPFGTTAAVIGLADSDLRFPGQYFDAESGLHYNYFRDYDPATGRYIQSDPIGLSGGLNTYAYVGGNPVNRVDPLGLADDGKIRIPAYPLPTLEDYDLQGQAIIGAAKKLAEYCKRMLFGDPDGDCEEIYKDIHRRVRSLKRRYDDLQLDEKDEIHDNPCGRYRHERAYRDEQRGLRNALNAAKEAGCFNYRPDADEWATKPIPFPKN
jgi:RHS repeat-associated protein